MLPAPVTTIILHMKPGWVDYFHGNSRFYYLILETESGLIHETYTFFLLLPGKEPHSLHHVFGST